MDAAATSRDGTTAAELRDTAAIMAQAGRTLDFTRAAAVLLLAILHFIPGTDEPARIVAALAMYAAVARTTNAHEGARCWPRDVIVVESRQVHDRGDDFRG